VRLATVARHSWSEPRGHFHQTWRPDPAEQSSGVSLPFFVGCHSAASSGCSEPSEFVTLARWPLHIGQPWPLTKRVLTVACHTWSGPRGQRHQTLRTLPAVTSAGVSDPFRLGCHCLASSGERAARLLLRQSRWLLQNGHPWPATRLSGVAFHW
jgi:hypothetical protein